MSDKSTQYSFVSREEDVNYDRILRESPKGTQFILVEDRDRKNQARGWTLLVHNSVLTDERVQGIKLGHEGTADGVKTISPTWGHDSAGPNDTPLYAYRAISAPDAVPGYVLQTVHAIKRALNEKDTKTVVTLF